MSQPARSRWLRNFHPAPDARIRLVCLPHAGGSASYYFPMSVALAPEFEVYGVQYPGRQDRHSEPFVDSIEEMADQVYTALGTLPPAPTAFFGHSMGAVLAFEVARRYETVGGRQAVTVFASGSRAPSRYGDEPDRKNDAQLVDVMRELGGTDPRVLNDRELLSTFLPAFRNDYTALQAYHRDTDIGIGAPIVVMTATDDPKTSEPAARAWHEHTTGGGEVHLFTGGHFFLEKQPQKVIEVVTSTLRAVG
ncbi:surfactin synthase thioesterase subunit [Mycolicibacterium iranicum]|uniref:Thioesterase TesA n=1 Tax=Mycolicibacterium iranicum TaxID=912594 RepID=A0A839QDB2_MYCIR|nr:alpha/beta fold hydrolase [Mycolicibacterium iranicum]MBB2993597.1 surfactin synthase thioesterase subunit [Mycolicibacterium iranicum]